jgi:hypothetical protein
MSAVRREYKVEICLRSPFLFKGVTNTQIGVDAAFLRDEQGRSIIPGPQIRGVLKAALGAMVDAGYPGLDLNMLFGGESAGENAEGRNIPDRGAVNFSDLTMVEPAGLEAGQITRIEIDAATGAVKTGALQVIELAAPLGKECLFAGTLIMQFKDRDSADHHQAAVMKAVKLVPAIGALKSAGFGEVVAVPTVITHMTGKDRAIPAAAKAPDVQNGLYEVAFDRPLLVDAIRIADNIFESARIVPGAAFKGALAETLRIAGHDTMKGDLADSLSRLRISHAHPKSADGALLDLPIPMSWAFWEDSENQTRFHDLSQWQRGEAALSPAGAGGVQKALGLVSDAKQKIKDEARDKGKIPSMQASYLSRTQVAIDAETVSAMESKLFSTVLLQTAGAAWNVELDYSRISKPDHAALFHAVLSCGLDGIGRTGAVAQFRWLNAVPEVAALGNTLTFTVLTPAVMVDGKKAEGDFFSQCAAYFKEHFEGAELENMFAARKLGGGYLSHRYRAYDKSYYPFVLTAPGSVFRLSLPTQEARAAAREALIHGLPAATLDGKTPTWETCPFVRENGYGAISATRHHSDFVPERVRQADVC